MVADLLVPRYPYRYPLLSSIRITDRMKLNISAIHTGRLPDLLSDDDGWFVQLHDEQLDYGLDFIRSSIANRLPQIEIILQDQMNDTVTEIDVELQRDMLRAELPESLRQFAGNSPHITAKLHVDDHQLALLRGYLARIFNGIPRLSVAHDVPEFRGQL